jgi:Met-zincin
LTIGRLYLANIYQTFKAFEQAGPVSDFVPAHLQKEAVAFLHTQLLTPPLLLADKNILSMTGTSPASFINGMQGAVLDRLLSASTFNKLLMAETINPNTYTTSAFIQDLQNGI